MEGWLSGNWVARGDCNREEGAEIITGEETSVPAALLGVFGPVLVLPLSMEASSALSVAPELAGCTTASFDTTPTDAFSLLYNPLSPP